MARGNWQKRVETADARRKEAKQRKQKSEHTRQYKIWAQDFLNLLDRHEDQLKHLSFSKFHVWTDTLPVSNEQELRMAVNIKGRGSMGSSTEQTVGRGRSYSSAAAQGSKKKAHPRSKEVVVQEDVDCEPHQLRMCRSFFFTGKCDQQATRGGSGRKGGGCRYVHSDGGDAATTDMILYKVLSNRKTAHSKTSATDDLMKAEEALISFLGADEASDHPGAMDMVFYFAIPLKPTDGEGDVDVDLSVQITDFLSSSDLKLANIVYIAVGDVLVFDRYAQGSVYKSDRDYLVALLGDDCVGSRRDSVGGDVNEDPKAVTALQNLPGTILEHILTFLPDAAVASASRVCKAWHHEIGKNSPNLWENMLDRRRWPHPCISGDLEESAAQYDKHRVQFIEHYSVVRDVVAIKSGLHAITDQRRAAEAVVEQGMAFQDFSVRKHAPSFPNCCVGLQEWSRNRMLAAYQNDCSLRLFETIPKPGNSCGEIQCRELVCQRVDPYRHTKRRRCRMVSMGLDEECVGCLCHVTADNPSVSAEVYVLVVISRDDFLLGETSGVANAGGISEEMSNMTVIDVGEAVLNYLLCSNVGDYRLLQLIDFLSQGGSVGEVEVLASQVLAACGYGRFMVEVSIAIPVEDEDGISSMAMIDRRLVLFSAGVGAIVWMAESNPLPHELRPRGEEMIISYLRRPQRESGSRSACFLAVGTLTSPAIMVGQIEPSGSVLGFQLLEASLVVWAEIENDDWQVSTGGSRPIIVTPSDVVVADTLERRGQGGENKVTVSFFPRHFSSDEPSYGALTLEGNMQSLGICCIRDKHVILVCRCLPTLQQQPQRANEDEVLHRLDGQWFVEANDALDARRENDNAEASSTSARCAKVVAVVIHVASRREISRVALLEGLPPDDVSAPEIIAYCGETVGAGLSWKGVVITGDDVRSVSDGKTVMVLDEDPARSSKKEKKRKQNRGFIGKKDGFARGMSLRG